MDTNRFWAGAAALGFAALTSGCAAAAAVADEAVWIGTAGAATPHGTAGTYVLQQYNGRPLPAAVPLNTLPADACPSGRPAAAEAISGRIRVTEDGQTTIEAVTRVTCAAAAGTQSRELSQRIDGQVAFRADRARIRVGDSSATMTLGYDPVGALTQTTAGGVSVWKKMGTAEPTVTRASSAVDPEQRLRAALKQQGATLVDGRSAKTAFGVGSAALLGGNGEPLLWVRQTDASFRSPMADVGQELTLLMSPADAPRSVPLRVTARVAFQGGGDPCENLTGSGWAYAVERVGSQAGEEELPYAAQVLSGRVQPSNRPGPTQAVLTGMAAARFKLQNAAVTKYERENAAWLKQAPEQRETLHQGIYGTDASGKVTRRPSMENVDVYTLRRPEGTFHVVPLNMNDDPSDHGDVTLHTLVFDQAGQLIRQYDKRAFAGGAVVDIDGDGYDELLAERTLLRLEKGAILWPQESGEGEEEVCHT